MNLPQTGDYIDIHNHGGRAAADIFVIENLIASEEKTPEDNPQQACSFGIHPWYLTENNCDQLLSRVKSVTEFSNLLAIGEAGFDKLRGPAMGLQRKVFEEQLLVAGEHSKPVIIHCVRAWDELFAVHKTSQPKTPWLIHGFRGNVQLATQLLSKGMYVSFWFDFAIRPESAHLLRSVPKNRIFLETDGAEIDIREIYNKVANDLDLTINDLKSVILSNFNDFFLPQNP
jgi:TatD DNase family protein